MKDHHLILFIYAISSYPKRTSYSHVLSPSNQHTIHIKFAFNKTNLVLLTLIFDQIELLLNLKKRILLVGIIML